MTQRTLTGRVVPFNKPGRASVGTLHVAPGSLTWASDVSRVKLLIEHEQKWVVVGHALAIEEQHEDEVPGIFATFAVDDTPEATAALVSANRKLRDGLSYGAELSDETLQALATGRKVAGGTRANGQLREVSLVAVPAYDDARVLDITGLDAATDPQPAAAASAPIQHISGEPTVKLATAHSPQLATASAPTGLIATMLAAGHAAATATASTTPAAPAAGTTPATPPAGAAAVPAAPAAPAADQATAAAAPAATAPAAPATPAAAPDATAGGAIGTTGVREAPVYSFDGRGDSFVLDVFAAQGGDLEAAMRLARFNRAMGDEDSTQVQALAGLAERVTATGTLGTAAVQTRGNVADVDQLTPDNYRPDMLLRAIDQGRPLVSRVRQIPISGPNPFRLPTFGQYDGVGDHTEGTAHVAEGTADVGGQTVTPSAVSGAYRLSRELAESTGPRIDQLVLAEMISDYRRQSEARLVATLELIRAVVQATYTLPKELLKQLVTYYSTRKVAPTVAGMGWAAFADMATVEASDGRPYFPYLGPDNAAGTTTAGFTAINIQGVAGAPAWSADATDTWLLNDQDVAVFESAPRTFRFEEVEGPGVIKLAIWGYQAAHVFREEGVRRLGYVAPA